jgi:DMSO/TMAO reductase YedYZ molybdopterin-dependent catalytic subunit
MALLGTGGVFFGNQLSSLEQTLLAPLQTLDPTGITGLVPNGGGFRFYSVTSGTPSRTATDYRLTVGGLVRRPITLTLAGLHGMWQTAITKDFQCVTGWRVPDVHWAGVALPDLLDRVGVLPGAKAVRFTSFDGTYTESLTLAQARRRDVLVATSMIGKEVSRDHGGPVRLYVAPMYGYKSCKWLSGIELVDSVQPGYWEQLGYDVDAWVGRSNGRDDKPT